MSSESATTVWLSPPQIAKCYGIKPAKVIGWIRSGELRGINVAARVTGRPRFRVAAEDLAAFEARRTANPTVRPQQRRRRPPENITEYV